MKPSRMNPRRGLKPITRDEKTLRTKCGPYFSAQQEAKDREDAANRAGYNPKLVQIRKERAAELKVRKVVFLGRVGEG